MQYTNHSVKYRAGEVKTPWPKQTRSFNWKLIPKHMEQLARAGKVYDDKIITKPWTTAQKI